MQTQRTRFLCFLSCRYNTIRFVSEFPILLVIYVYKLQIHYYKCAIKYFQWTAPAEDQTQDLLTVMRQCYPPCCPSTDGNDTVSSIGSVSNESTYLEFLNNIYLLVSILQTPTLLAL